MEVRFVITRYDLFYSTIDSKPYFSNIAQMFHEKQPCEVTLQQLEEKYNFSNLTIKQITFTTTN